MRATLTTLLLAVLAAVSVCACSKSSSAAATSADPTPTATATADIGGATGSPPIYPGAVPGVRPEGVGFNAPPPQVKAYSTSDDFATVKAWYQAHLKGASEMARPGMEKTEDAFLVGRGASGSVVLVQSFKGKTWILIGPPM